MTSFLKRLLLPLCCVACASGSLGDSVIIINPNPPIGGPGPVLPTLLAPADGDYGGKGAAAVATATLTNPAYPTANGAAVTVTVYHPVGAGGANAIDSTLPTIFFAHDYPYSQWGPRPVGLAADYASVLTHLASRGYNVVFSPYESATSTHNVSNAQRFDELVSGWEAAVATYGLNTAQVGFVGHTFGAGMLPAAIRHETMGLADAWRAGNRWGDFGMFLFSMAPGFALDGGGETGVGGAQAITVPANLTAVVQVYQNDQSYADPSMALDLFYHLSVPYGQKNFLTIYNGREGSFADQFLPTSSDFDHEQAWKVLRPLDALAAYTFTGNPAARPLALGGGVPAQTYTGTLSDGSLNYPLQATDHPAFPPYRGVYYNYHWSDPANPRASYPVPSNTAFFNGALPLSNGVYYLTFANGNPLGYFSYQEDFHYVYHFDLGWEYCFDAADEKGGVYLYDFASRSFFYTSPSYPFPYLYDFSLGAVLYYYPVAGGTDRYTSGPRYFYNFSTDRIITK